MHCLRLLLPPASDPPQIADLRPPIRRIANYLGMVVISTRFSPPLSTLFGPPKIAVATGDANFGWTPDWRVFLAASSPRGANRISVKNQLTGTFLLYGSRHKGKGNAVEIERENYL